MATAQLATLVQYKDVYPSSVQYTAQYVQFFGVWGQGLIQRIYVQAKGTNPCAGCKSFFEYLLSEQTQPLRVRFVNLEPEPHHLLKEPLQASVTLTPGDYTPLDRVIVVDEQGEHVIRVQPDTGIV